ncbi:MAG: glutamine synthetase family protein [Gemmobacter sp.]
MPGTLTLDALRQAVDDGAIDTVIVAAVDMQGRLMGKRFHARHFADHGWRETHCCNYLLAVDMEMTPVPGYASANWAAGYGDYTVRPDLSTLRRIPWAPGAALVLADLIDHHAEAEVAVSPRAILRRQIARARAMGFEPMMATELEFYLFDNSYESLRGGVTGLRPVSGYNEDYHIFQPAKVEAIMRAVRNGLHDAGVPVESTKGEAEAGQHEINIRYSDALDAADNHVITKAAIKEIAWAQGRSVTFMAKYDHRRAGSSAHVHQSLWADGEPAFLGVGAGHAMSPTMQHYLAGQLAHARDIAAFLAPTVNSYKRFTTGMFAPTKAVWSSDNRTAGFRVVGEGTRGQRIECRIPGADINPYLCLAALLAAGLAGIEERLPLEPEARGDNYAAQGVREIPHTLREAADLLHGSAMLRSAFGSDVVDHYVHAARWEVSEMDRVVTDFELARGFERA